MADHPTLAGIEGETSMKIGAEGMDLKPLINPPARTKQQATRLS
jgi:hypothetical protein